MNIKIYTLLHSSCVREIITIIIIIIIITIIIIIIIIIILLHEKFLQFDWLRAVVLQLDLKYLHVKITNLLWVVV